MDDEDDDFFDLLKDMQEFEDMIMIHVLNNEYDEDDEEEEDEEEDEEEVEGEHEVEEDQTDSHTDPILLDAKFESRRNLGFEINQEKESISLDRGVPKEIYINSSLESKTMEKTGEDNGSNLKRKASNEEPIMSSDENNIHGNKRKNAKR